MPGSETVQSCMHFQGGMKIWAVSHRHQPAVVHFARMLLGNKCWHHLVVPDALCPTSIMFIPFFLIFTQTPDRTQFVTEHNPLVQSSLDAEKGQDQRRSFSTPSLRLTTCSNASRLT
jgi:hypothetical protein